MLNYIALWVGVYLFALGGPLQNDRDKSVPVSNDIVDKAPPAGVVGRPGAAGPAHRPVHRARRGGRVLGAPEPLDDGLRGARGRPQPRGRALRRHERRQELRARDGGLRRVRRAWPGALDVLGWQFRLATNDIQVSQIGFLGIAVALLGRNTAVGTVAAALLFGALLSGTSQRNLDPSIFEPELASNLTLIIQGLVVLVVSADVLVLGILRRGAACCSDAAGRRRSWTRERRHDRRLALGAEREAARLGRRGAGRGRLVHHAAAAAGAHAGPVAGARAAWPSAPAWRPLARGERQARARRHHRRRGRRDRRRGRDEVGRRPTWRRCSSGRRCSPRCCASRRRCCSPRSAGSCPSAAASSTSGSRA